MAVITQSALCILSALYVQPHYAVQTDKERQLM
jgi:hypothetical protein